MENDLRVAFIATDYAPCATFKMLADGLVSKGHVVSELLGFGKGIYFPVDAYKNYDLVLIGMSSTGERSAGEIAAAKYCHEHEKSYGFFADIYGCHRRPWFKEVLTNADFLFVLDEEEKRDAEKYVPGVEVFATGNPTWQKFFERPTTREEVCKKLKLKLDPSRKIIVATGGKTLVTNMAQWAGVVSACVCLAHLYTFPQLILARHPGDQNPRALYEDLIRFSSVPVQIVEKDDNVPISELLCAADLLVSFYSTNSIEAAAKRVPVIDFHTTQAEEEWELIYGNTDWKPIDKHLVECVKDNPLALGHRMMNMLHINDYSAFQKKKHEELLPPDPVCLLKMVETLLAQVKTSVT